MTAKKIFRCSALVLAGLALCFAVSLVWYQVLRLRDAIRYPRRPIFEAMGVYSWDLSEYYPPGSPRAKAILGEMSNCFAGMVTDRPIYIRFGGPGMGGNDDVPFMWDFKASPELLKEWQEQVRSGCDGPQVDSPEEESIDPLKGH